MSSYEETPDVPAPAPEKKAPEKKARKSTGKMSDQQKAQLKKHMDKHKKAGMSVSEMKSHRMKMMARMRKGMTVQKAHNDIKKGSK